MKKIYYIYLTLNYYVDLLPTASQLVLASELQPALSNTQFPYRLHHSYFFLLVFVIYQNSHFGYLETGYGCIPAPRLQR